MLPGRAGSLASEQDGLVRAAFGKADATGDGVLNEREFQFVAWLTFEAALGLRGASAPGVVCRRRGRAWPVRSRLCLAGLRFRMITFPSGIPWANLWFRVDCHAWGPIE